MYCLPLYPTDGTLRHWVCFPKPQRALAAIQGKPSLHWHSFEHASRTTSHGLDQKNVDFSQSFYSSMAGLDLIGRGLLYFLLYITAFSVAASEAWDTSESLMLSLYLKKKKLNEEFYSKPLRIYIGVRVVAWSHHRVIQRLQKIWFIKCPLTVARKGLNIPVILLKA